MTGITVIAVGTLSENYWREAFAEYSKRLGAYCTFEMLEIKEEKLPSDPSASEISMAIEKEGERILARIPKKARSVALCVEGKLFSTEELAAYVQEAAVYGEGHLCFIVGGSYGLSEQVKKQCRLRLSFSKMTFPHQMMRVILLEQLYRAHNLLSGGKYHK